LVVTGPVVRRRIALSMVLFLALFFALIAQLFKLQILEAEELQQRAQTQWTSQSVIAPRRGSILDRSGRVLAISATAYTASVSPRQVADAKAFARILAPVLNMEESTIIKKASDVSKGGVILKRQLSRETAQQLRTMVAEQLKAGSKALEGLYLEEDARRYYPMGAFASQLIGLTSIDGVGQAGLEASLDKYLSGKAGSVLSEIDGKGRRLGYGESEYIPSVDGGSVTLTLDASIQSFVEQAAREAISVNGAKAVRVLVMDPRTGEILAMCSKPDFDLNDPPRDDVEKLNELLRNRVIADAYEPGSTFKIVTTSSALDAGVTSVNDGFYCSGSVVVDGSRIHCWTSSHGAETLAQGLQNSCNPVFVELALRLGIERFYKYLDAYGLGMVTGVDIPGEGTGILIDETKVKRVDIARIGFGQSIAVTPLQLLTAACAAINGGNLMKPYVVKEIVDASGNVVERGEPQVVETPISKATSATMRKLLELVVEKGGGKNARIPGYRIGGKTGTAQVYVNGVVSKDTHIGSFLGFAPADDPKVAILVIVDEAAKRPDFGAVTAAPFARDILQKTLAYMGIAPATKEKPEEPAIVPDVTGLTEANAEKALKAVGLDCLVSGETGLVVDQMPAPGAHMARKSLVMLYMKDAGDDAREVAVPDLTGLSILEANRLLFAYGLQMKADGSGVAASQSPAAGDNVTPTTLVRVKFQAPGG
jgi:stage V sporulation protein D (sporulation-specific penicillin-binding protein)